MRASHQQQEHRLRHILRHRRIARLPPRAAKHQVRITLHDLRERLLIEGSA
jgi:hypothetical protein